MHLHEKLDLLFAKGSIWKHRTLRTLFDKNSSEWKHTDLDKKVEIIHKAIDSNLLTFKEMIDGFVDFYTYDVAGKEHALLSLDDAIGDLKKHSLKLGREI